MVIYSGKWKIGSDPPELFFGGSFSMIFNLIQGGAPKIAFSWFITPITMGYGRYNYS